MSKLHRIKKVLKDSIAEEVGIEAGDYLLQINGNKIEDALDYHYLCMDEYIEVLVKKTNNEEWLIEVDKEEEEELGIEFEDSLMDEYKSCNNKCIFCFIDQLPEGMRDTLYFKDDDSRLSFLQGNYITLTNMKETDVERIIKYRLSPVKISVNTTNIELRKKMLNNRFADNIIHYIKKLYDARIIMNGQIVLCRGWNDNEELNKTISDLSKYIPYLQSVSVVPVGITKFRQGLCNLEAFEKKDAIQTLKIIHYWQKMLYNEYGTHFIHASDEFYILAEDEIPSAESYDGYLQYENGVGMLRLLIDEVDEYLLTLKSDSRKRELSIATGVLAYPFICELVDKINKLFPNISVNIYKIINQFFGEHITVSGLLTGNDIINQLKGHILGDKLLLPCNLLRSGEQCLLDDVLVSDIEKSLQVKITIVKSTGKEFIKSVIE